MAQALPGMAILFNAGWLTELPLLPKRLLARFVVSVTSGKDGAPCAFMIAFARLPGADWQNDRAKEISL